MTSDAILISGFCLVFAAMVVSTFLQFDDFDYIEYFYGDEPSDLE